MLIMLLIMSILNLYNIYSDYSKNVHNEKNYYKAYFEMYDKVSGSWNKETIDYVVSEYERTKSIIDSGDFSTEPNQPNTYTGYIFGDYGLFEKIKSEMEMMYRYNDRSAEISAKAKENEDFYKLKNNQYLSKTNTKIQKSFQNREIEAFYDTWGMTEYFKYDFSTLMILIIIIPLLSPVFAKEHETEMYSLLKITYNFKKLSICKMIAGAMAVFIVSILFLAMDLGTFTLLYHIHGLSQPIYSLPDYLYTPLTMKISDYIILNSIIKIAGFMILGEICLLISSAVKNEVIPFIFSFIITLFLVIADAFADNYIIMSMNPVSLFSFGNQLKDFNFLRIMNTPVYSFWFPIISALLEFSVLTFAVVVITKLKSTTHNNSKRYKNEI